MTGAPLIRRFVEPRMGLLAMLLVLAAHALSIPLRFSMLLETSGAQGLEATYHTLWTAQALSGSPASSHYYLPTVTLRPEPENPITWGATLPTKGGSYIYTSFPPLGFLLAKTAIDLAPGIAPFQALVAFNMGLGFLAGLGLAGLARQVALAVTPESARRKKAGWTAFAFVGVVYPLLRESLIAHGSVYWPHSVAQLPFIWGCRAAFRAFQGRRDALTLWSLAGSCFFYASLEWSGYVFSIGLACALALDQARRGARRLGEFWPAAAPLAAAALAAVILLAHFALALGLKTYVASVLKRGSSRSFSFSGFYRLLKGYGLSFGVLVPFCALAGLTLASRKGSSPESGSVRLLLLTAAFPMIENLLLAQHAAEFSFDRMKLAVPLLLVATLFLTRAPLHRFPLATAGAACLLIWSNVENFIIEARPRRIWSESRRANNAVLEAFKQNLRAECATLGTNLDVRGYLNLSFDRDIFEFIAPEALQEKAQNDARSCGAAFITTRYDFGGLHIILSIDLFDESGALIEHFEPKRKTAARP